jgi:hypothetical protein
MFRTRQSFLSSAWMVLAIAVAGCSTPMSNSRQEKLHGLALYGLVNRDPSLTESASYIRSAEAKSSCTQYPDDFCRFPDNFDFVTALISNTYWGGIRNIGFFAPRALQIRKSDVVVVRFRRGGAGEFVRIASRGETATCGWKGGGPTRALTAAGVVCQDYDWETYRALLYD